MPTFPYSRLAAFLLVLWAIPLHAQVGNEPGYVLLKRVLGAVTVEVKGVSPPAPAVNDQRIAEQTIVTTAEQASVILLFSNGATVTLGPNSTLDIEEFVQDPFAESQALNTLVAEPSSSRTQLSLTRGELIGTVRTLKQEAGSSFIVRTPAGAAGIRGTTFRIVFQPDAQGGAAFSLTVVEGEVGYIVPGGAFETSSAIVSENQQLIVDVAINSQTGEVTVLTPLAAMVPQPAPVDQIAALTQAVQEVLQELFNLVLPPSASVNPFVPTAPPADAGAGEESPPPPPPLLGRTNPDLTPGDGVAGP